LCRRQPRSPEDAKGLASRLCLFVAGPCGRHRRCAPDLEQLLSRAAIDAHLARLAAADTAKKTRENHRADLQRVARALVGASPVGVPGRSRPEKGAGELSRVAAALHAAGCSLAAGAVAFEQRSARPLRREDLEPLSVLSRANAACARSDGAGTIPAPSELEALVDAVDLVSAVEEVAEKTPAETHRAPATARTSRPKRLPAASWAELRPVWERLIVGFAPASRRAVGGPAAVLLGFLCWADERRAAPGAALA
jgi:hypothetical protein